MASPATTINLKVQLLVQSNPFNVIPISAGLSATVTPASRSAFFLSSAPPCPPEIIAPACPIRLPGGAVLPAIKATTGLVTCSRKIGRASCREGVKVSAEEDALYKTH